MKNNAEIMVMARTALQSERRIGRRFHLEEVAFAPDGALIIAGEVETVAAKKLALEHIGALKGVDLIVDRMRVRPATPMGDAEIRSHIRTSFLQEPSFAGLVISEARNGVCEVIATRADASGNLQFEVAEGLVTLNGNVPGLNTKRLAGLLAWWVPGTRDVINGIAVPDSEVDSPIAMEEAVQLALERDPFVNAAQIRVGVRERVVRLTGLVASDAERDMAEKDAWYVFGTNDVINEIEVGI